MQEVRYLYEWIRRTQLPQDFSSDLCAKARAGGFFEDAFRVLFSIKNPGFIEEREWRFIYQDTASSTLASDIVSVDGIPQVIYKLPWRAVGESGAGLPIADALEQIIIGPSQYADVIEVAFTRCLSELGITDAAKRVVKSNIPLR